jgi:hypothetical protein
MKLALHIEGETPLLQNNAAVMLAAKETTKAKADRPPNEQAATSVYMQDDLYVHPTIAFRNAFIGGAKKVKSPLGRGFAATPFAAAATLHPLDYAVLSDSKGKPLTKYDIYVTTVRRPPRTGGRVTSGRAKWNDWHVFLDLELDERIWPKEANDSLDAIFEFAGLMQGVGEHRPELRGIGFGKFKVNIVT